MFKDKLKIQLKTYENEFIEFMRIEKFPSYELQIKEVSLITAVSQGFESAAATHFDLSNNSHILKISANIPLSKYLVFHEFTHILDTEMYVKSDKNRYAGLSGFTEYHASQIELMQLLGAKTADEILSFSMDKIITTYAGDKSVYQYITEKHQHAVELFSRSDFPANVETLKSAIGILYNYFGLRSICESYAADYEEIIENKAFLKFIPTMFFVAINGLMHGWHDESNIEQSIPIYINTIYPLIMKHKLI